MPKMQETSTYKIFKIITSSIFFLFLLAIFLAIYFHYKQNPSEINDDITDIPPMKISTNIFLTGNNINPKYTCDGANVSPDISISSVPLKAKTLIVIMQDASSNPGGFVHWLMRNIPAANSVELKEGKMPLSLNVGTNDFGKSTYGGPCPPKGEKHEYYIKIFALDTTLDLENSSNIYQLQGAMNSRIISQTEISGFYHR